MRSWARPARAMAFACLSAAGVLRPGVAAAAPPEPPQKADCVASYERSQELRAAGKMREAGDFLVRCAAPMCPTFIQSDCTQWLVEVQRDMPTVVLAVKDQKGQETSHVRVTVDGELLTEELDGRAHPVNPGAHVFRFEIAGADPIETKVLVRQGQKARSVEVSFAPSGGDLPDDSPYTNYERPPPPPEPAAPPPPSKEWLRPYAYAAGGLGVLGVIGFAALGASGKTREHDLRDSCGTRCNPDDVDSVRTRYILADVSLGVGIAGLGTGVALFLLSLPKKEDARLEGRRTVIDVRPGNGSAVVTFSGAF